ncbi:hypothetical protein [uncultured Marivita sp.]|uniref:hypothetical protein n=1 Tax=uncultured Marivita sp. TaxID=888080 RepID=UPI00261AA7DE|nr:hypothetical protein [uncultured Marivita sp.]
MQTGVLRVLRATAASWWRHRELRRTGQTALAQRLERQIVLRDLGWTTVSSFAPIERFPLAALAVARGTPFIDLRPVTDVIAFANLPRVAQDGSVDPDPCGPGRSVSLTTYIDMVVKLGASITNDPRSRQSI